MKGLELDEASPFQETPSLDGQPRLEELQAENAQLKDRVALLEQREQQGLTDLVILLFQRHYPDFPQPLPALCLSQIDTSLQLYAQQTQELLTLYTKTTSTSFDPAKGDSLTGTIENHIKNLRREIARLKGLLRKNAVDLSLAGSVQEKLPRP